MTTSPARAIGSYTAEQVARLAGVSARRIGRWAQLGIVPSVSATPRVYSYADAGEAILAHHLVMKGMRPAEIRAVVEWLRERFGQWPLATAPLQSEGALLVMRDGELLLEPVSEQQLMPGTLANLESLRDALRHGGWVSLSKPRQLISVDPQRHSGAPTLRGRRIPTRLVARLAAERDGVETLRDGYGLSDEEIAEAVGYERDVEEAIAA
jgi:uncharacterized protein (DUF433 family)/DNA-binding transcriptional MerR regulator